jgi:hypothetical protein
VHRGFIFARLMSGGMEIAKKETDDKPDAGMSLNRSTSSENERESPC